MRHLTRVPRGIPPNYRRIPGGLDNAAKEAAQRHLEELFIVDVDCHAGEPFTRFSKYLPEDQRKEYARAGSEAEVEHYGEARSPQTRSTGKKMISELSKSKWAAYARYYDIHLKGRIRRPESKGRDESQEKNTIWEQKPEDVIEMFAERMHDIGIKRSIIFPERMLGLGNHPDPSLEVAVANAYADYMLDKFLGKYPEILSCVYAPANTPAMAAELIERVGKEKGMVGVTVTPSRPGPLAGDRSWNMVYEAAQRIGLPICFHASANHKPGHDLDRFTPGVYLPVVALGFPWFLILHLTSIVLEGVPERFPNLKFVWLEGGITWIPWIMNRLDTIYMMRRSEAPLLKKRPSEYIKRFYFSSQPLERPTNKGDLEFFFRSFNAEERLMYASDYPHWDFDMPSSIYDLPFLSRQAKEKILGGNAKSLFKIT